MIRFRCLGSIDLTRSDGTSVVEVVSQPKRVALLSYIALFNHGGFVPRDRLLEVFWPESDTERARNSLNQAVHGLRGALGERALETRGRHELRLSPDHLWCDARAFQEALDESEWKAASALYQGDLLEGLHISGGGGFEPWLGEQRLRLRRGFCDAAWRLVDAAEAEGERGEAVSLAREAVAKSPFDEVAMRRLMRLLSRLGDRAGALEVYARGVERLAQHLDVAPDPETEGLANSLREPGPRTPDADLVGSAIDNGWAPDPSRPVRGHRPDSSSMPPRSRRTRRRLPLTIGALTIAASALALTNRGPVPELSPTRSVLLVQPFENRTGDERFDFVGEAAANAIAVGLNSRSGDLMGIVALSLRDFNLPDALVVTGHYESVADSLALHVQVALPNGAPLRVEGPVTGPAFDAGPALGQIRDRVAVIAASHFGIEATPVADAPLPSWEAWQEYDEGRQHSGRADYPRALPYLERAVEIDPSFTSALAELSIIYANLGELELADSLYRITVERQDDLNPLERGRLEWMTAALHNDRPRRLQVWREQMLLMGLTEDIQLVYELLGLNRPAEALDALSRMDEVEMVSRAEIRYWTFRARGHHLLGDYDAELDAVRRGLEFFPNHLILLGYEAKALGALGRVDEIEAVVEAAVAAPEGSSFCCPVFVAETGGRELLLHGFEPAASRIFALGIRLHEELALDSEGDRHVFARVLLAAGHWEAAAKVFGELHEEFPESPGYLGGLGIATARLGQQQEAHRIIAELEPDHYLALQKPQAWVLRARIAAALGDLDGAMTLLRRATSNGAAVERTHHQLEFLELRNTEAFERWEAPVG